MKSFALFVLVFAACSSKPAPQTVQKEVTVVKTKGECPCKGKKGHHGQGHGDKSAKLKKAGATDQQIEQIKALHESAQAEAKALRDQKKAAQKAIKAELDKESPDQAALEQQIELLAQADGQLAGKRAATKVQARMILGKEIFSKMHHGEGCSKCGHGKAKRHGKKHYGQKHHKKHGHHKACDNCKNKKKPCDKCKNKKKGCADCKGKKDGCDKCKRKHSGHGHKKPASSEPI